ncbi:unnamed protein product [Pseudo-nitzschia multistriata]|uniref:Protein kinase domain-containing protein n=1 Tax=Pseudo-nitzschia multistriata TaxID=183589 RepID=A0A448ZCV3_9STRA|nr:unnamed protein product [Pseudo-nitzschia multistriata]
MGKRPRTTPHYITGIGDGDVHDGTPNDDGSRLRGSNNGNNGNNGNNHKNKHKNSHHNSGSNGNHAHGHAYHGRQDLRHHREKHDPEQLAAREEILHRIEDPLLARDAAAVALNLDLNLDPGTLAPGELGLGPDAGAAKTAMNEMDASGQWQASSLVFYGLGVVVVVGIALHFVAEFSSVGRIMMIRHDHCNGKGRTKSGRHGSQSRPYQYRRRQRQRRIQKLRKKKTDEWSDDEEPIQDGAGLFSMGNHQHQHHHTGSSSKTGNSSGDGNANGDYDYGSPQYRPYPFDYDPHNGYGYGYDYDYEHDYDYDRQHKSGSGSNNSGSNHPIHGHTHGTGTASSSVYHSNEYYREPDSHLAGQDLSHRRTGAAGRDPQPQHYDYYAGAGAGAATTGAATTSAATTGAATTGAATTAGASAGARAQGAAGVVPTYKFPARKKHPQRGVSPMSSYSSVGSGARPRAATPGRGTGTHPLSQPRLRTPSHTPDRFASGTGWQHLPRPQKGATALDPMVLLAPAEASRSKRTTELGASRLPADPASRFSSFASIADAGRLSGDSGNDNEKDNENADADTKGHRGEHHRHGSGEGHQEASSASEAWSSRSFSSHHSPVLPKSVLGDSIASAALHQKSLMLTPGNSDFQETPLIGNVRKTIAICDGSEPSLELAALMPMAPEVADSCAGSKGAVEGTTIPFLPHLKVPPDGSLDVGLTPPVRSASPPPRSILLDELRLVEMETGNSTHWNDTEVVGDPFGLPDDEESQSQPREAPDYESSASNRPASGESTDVSIPSDDPRKSIVHKRQNLTMATDSAKSLQSSIDFAELQLQEVIGGGGFGQVWKATWRGTPVAVKVLTGSAQNTHIAKAILEEFKAEINLLKGMRHPNICLYMGACMTPPNRAIITELAANGSVWDSLRLPLMPPYTASDGTPNGSWPLSLYLPSHHGVPPTSSGSVLRATTEISAPIPPRGTWPWELVKRVSCGAARGMAYLHSGHPPVLHRDLKSANLLLDESYTTKVCDFGLSRLKAQARSMTANCGTVQWMAPEVLANRSYDERADVYSFGIIVWELLSRECPYEGMTAIQCALAVLNRDKRPEIPKWCPPGLHALIKSCTKKDPSERPSFAEIIAALDAMG